MQVGDGVRNGEDRLEIEMQGAVTQRRQVHEGRAVVSRLQGKSQIDSDGGGAAAAFCVHDGEHFSPRTFAPGLAAACAQADEGFEQIGGGGGTLNVFADSGPHGTDNQLRLGHGADGEHGGIGKLLMQQLHRPQRRGDAIGGDVDQNHVGGEGLSSADDRVVGSQRHGRVAAHGVRHAGAIHQNLEHRALIMVRGEHGY